MALGRRGGRKQKRAKRRADRKQRGGRGLGKRALRGRSYEEGSQLVRPGGAGGGMAAQEAEAAQQNKLSDDFEQVASWARHSRYRDIENAMNQPDWMLPIDYQDELGNTLLSIAVQNGNKRIAKLCLRRGANVNLPNNTGQTVLHYAYAYGFEDLAEYLKSKGADDRPKNADGLTCYEGLSMEEIEQI